MSDFQESERDILITLRAETKAMKESVDLLHASTVKQWEKIDEHSQEISVIKNDVKTGGEKQKDHEEGHRWWAGAVIGISGLIMGAIEFLRGKGGHQ